MSSSVALTPYGVYRCLEDVSSYEALNSVLPMTRNNANQNRPVCRESGLVDVFCKVFPNFSSNIISMSSVQEVCKILADLSQGVANTITENSQHVSKNEELKSIANLYFENTTKTLNLFNKFMHTDEFATQYESVYKDHVILLEKIRKLEVVLEKKHKLAKTGRRVAVGFLAALFLPAVALVVVAASNPAAGQAGEKSVEAMKKTYELTKLLKKGENSKETLLGLSLLIGNRTEVNIEAMKTIKTIKRDTVIVW